MSWSKPGMKKIWILFAKGQEAQARNMQTPDRNWQGCKPTSFLVRGNRRQPPLFFSVCMWVWRLSLCPKSFNSHSRSSLSFPPHRIMYYLYRFSYCGISPKTFSVYNSPPSTRRGNCIFFYLFIYFSPTLGTNCSCLNYQPAAQCWRSHFSQWGPCMAGVNRGHAQNLGWVSSGTETPQSLSAKSIMCHGKLIGYESVQMWWWRCCW